MQTETVEVRKIVADAGKVLRVKKTGEIVGRTVYLAKSESQGDYEEVDAPQEEELIDTPE